jgi:hypothetical protein
VYRTLPGLDEELNVYVQYGDNGREWGVYEGSEAVKNLMEFMDPGSVRERQVYQPEYNLDNPQLISTVEIFLAR